MFEQYIKSATVLLRYGVNAMIIGFLIKTQEGMLIARLHNVDEKGNISHPCEITRSKIDEGRKIMDYAPINKKEWRTLKDNLQSCWFSLAQIEEAKGVGFIRNSDNAIISYQGSKCFGFEGERLIKDEFAELPLCKGNIENLVDRLNPYMKKNIKRQIVLVHALAGAICGGINRNIILAVCGESSTGKTTLQKMGASFFAQKDYSKTFLKWSATQNALVKRLDGLSGVNVLIDDTQLSKTKEFAPIIYSFENGRSIDRLIKSNEICSSFYWSVSIGITAEKSLLDTFKDLGAVARMIEMQVYKTDLFDDETEVSEIDKMLSNNYGILGTTFVKYLLTNCGMEKIERLVKQEGQKLCKIFKERIGDNHILKRHLEGDIAIMITTARLANNYFGFEFQIPHLYSALLGLCEENIRTFESNQFENIVADIIYTDIVATTREKYPQNEVDGKIIVPSSIMKYLLLKYVNEFKVKATHIKCELARQNLLSERKGVYCWNHTIQGQDVTGYEIILKEVS